MRILSERLQCGPFFYLQLDALYGRFCAIELSNVLQSNNRCLFFNDVTETAKVSKVTRTRVYADAGCSLQNISLNLFCVGFFY